MNSRAKKRMGSSLDFMEFLQLVGLPINQRKKRKECEDLSAGS
jgi:hypothetical protein